MTRPQGIRLRAGTPANGPALRDLHEASIRAFGISAYTPVEVESWVGVLEPHRYGEAMTKYGEVFLLAAAEAAIAAAGHGRIRIGASLSGRAFYEAKGYRVVADRVWKSRGGLDMAALDMEKRVADSS